MEELQHLFPRGTGQVYPYQYPRIVVPAEFAVPGRDVVPHSQTLLAQISEAQNSPKLKNWKRAANRQRAWCLSFRVIRISNLCCKDSSQRARVSNYETRELMAIIR